MAPVDGSLAYCALDDPHSVVHSTAFQSPYFTDLVPKWLRERGDGRSYEPTARQVTTIALLGTPSATRLAQILDAAVHRLGLTEIAVIADSEMDALACQWNRRRYQLTRYWGQVPRCEIALVFGGYAGAVDATRLIIIDGPAGSEGADK